MTKITTVIPEVKNSDRNFNEIPEAQAFIGRWGTPSNPRELYIRLGDLQNMVIFVGTKGELSSSSYKYTNPMIYDYAPVDLKIEAILK